MADVYLARDTEKDRKVALKLIEFTLDPETQAAVEAERRGAALQAKLCESEPCVPKIHQYGEVEGHFYIDMEYVEGQDLADLVRQGAIPPHQAIEIAIRLCKALACAHALITALGEQEFHGIVHGDIKPKNIRVDPQGNVRILDFGIAKGLSHSRQLTRNEFASLAYSAPERLDTGNMDQRSDLWAVGVVLYEMISGRQPFEADTTRRLESLIRSRKFKPLPPSICPEPLNRIIMKALAPDPSLRYESASDLQSDLEAFLAGQPTRAELEELSDHGETRRTHPLEDFDETRPSVPPLVLPVQQSPAAPRRSARTITLISSILVAIISVAFVLSITQEAVVWRAAMRARHQLELPGSSVDRAWSEYQSLSDRSYLGLGTIPLRSQLSQALISEADSVINDYKNNDLPRTTKADWKRAQDCLYKASQLDPGDKTTLAKIYYAEGHLQRLNHKPAAAVAAFRRAAELAPKWADPQLGLANSYVYGMNDTDKAEAALRRSEELGYKPGKRERAQLADTYRNRGYQFWHQAEAVAGMPQEKQFLLKAKQSFEQGLEFYHSLAPWGESMKNIKTLQENLEEIQVVLKELEDEQKAAGQKPPL
jgi:serine/threonine protein kinase